MAASIHLVRHAEVENPRHVCYASLPGYGLSDRGARQAAAAARYLQQRPIVAVWSSPLERALRSAEPIARAVGLVVRIDLRLTEWRLADRWAGLVWEELPDRRPGELEAYLAHPQQLPFSPESLAGLTERMEEVLEDLHRRHPDGEVVVVSHQDPVQAVRLRLTGGSPDLLHTDKPGHAAVISLRPGRPWREDGIWQPADAEPFPPT